MPFIPNTDDDRQEMLKKIGVKEFNDLISNIPEDIRFKDKFNLPEPLSEYEITTLLKSIARQNTGCDDFITFLGGGAYDHYIPAAIDHIVSRSEFYTAYTPYQPEVSQGTLQVIYEYQSMIAELTAMDVANASVYDGGSALAEAALMTLSSPKKKKIIISKTINPFYRQVITTYLQGFDVSVEIIDHSEGVTDPDKLTRSIDDTTAAVLIQHPNFFGCLEPVHELEKIVHQHGAVFISSNDPISLAILEAPGNYGVDIATAEGQCLGNALNFGGPYLGIMAAKQQYLRKIPGRIAGMTVDNQGREGFVLTFQTREQHIRREKATSNICTNQALNALTATVYLALLGKQGLREVASLCLQNSHYLAEQIQQIEGFKLTFNKPFFKEFVVSTPIKPDEIIKKMELKQIHAGINLERFDTGLTDCLLIAVTEKRTRKQMDKFISELQGMSVAHN